MTVSIRPEMEGMGMSILTREGVTCSTQNMSWMTEPIEEGCQCPACRNYSRAYIRHLLKAKEMLGMRLCVLHNLYFYNTMMTEIRDALDAGNFEEYKRKNWLEWKKTLEEIAIFVYDVL